MPPSQRDIAQFFDFVNELTPKYLNSRQNSNQCEEYFQVIKNAVNQMTKGQAKE